MPSFDKFLDTEEGLKLMAKAFEDILIHGGVTSQTAQEVRAAVLRFVRNTKNPRASKP